MARSVFQHAKKYRKKKAKSPKLSPNMCMLEMSGHIALEKGYITGEKKWVKIDCSIVA